jgi:predicted ATPase
MATLAEIEKKTQDYAAARENLNSLVWLLNEKIKDLKEEHLPAIREAAAETANRKETLNAALSDSKDLFQKPKTLIIMGIKVGFKKMTGALS